MIPREALRRGLVWIAGGALLVAMATDTLAMLGRHLRLPLLGSIEIVQAAVLVASSGALLLATALEVHARVHLLQPRLPAGARLALERLSLLAGILLVLALLAGSLWITVDLWHGHEESELLRIPWRPLRLVVLLLLAGLLGILLRRLFTGKAR
jgi:TRAP-type C4-dicarboxylate transport system permease small subunit